MFGTNLPRVHEKAMGGEGGGAGSKVLDQNGWERRLLVEDHEFRLKGEDAA